MSPGYLTPQQELLFSHGFYGYWWDLAGLIPYRGDAYHKRIENLLVQHGFRDKKKEKK